MVMAAVAVKDESEIPKGVDDSKKLTPEKREELFEQVKKLKHVVRIINPPEIDEWVNQGKYNWLEAKHTIDMINELNPVHAIVDCPAKNLEEYKAFIADKVKAKLTVMFKADATHKIVGAASIIAKVTRDRIIEDLKKEANFDFGSGYLTDPKTQEFLKNFNPDYKHFRKSWQTYKDLMAKKQQKSLF